MCIIISCFTLLFLSFMGSVMKSKKGDKKPERLFILLSSLCVFILQHIYSFGDMIVMMRFVSVQPSPLSLISSRKKIIRHPDSDAMIIRWWYKQYTKCLQRKICWYTYSAFYYIIITISDCFSAASTLFIKLPGKNLIPSKTLNLLSSSSASYCLRNKVITWIGLVPYHYHIIASYHFRSFFCRLNTVIKEEKGGGKLLKLSFTNWPGFWYCSFIISFFLRLNHQLIKFSFGLVWCMYASWGLKNFWNVNYNCGTALPCATFFVQWIFKYNENF